MRSILGALCSIYKLIIDRFIVFENKIHEIFIKKKQKKKKDPNMIAEKERGTSLFARRDGLTEPISLLQSTD